MDMMAVALCRHYNLGMFLVTRLNVRFEVLIVRPKHEYVMRLLEYILFLETGLSQLD